MALFSSLGKLVYYDDPYKLIVEVDPEISKYYFSFIPKYICANKQKYQPHISVVRKENPNPEYWKYYNNELIYFYYENIVYNDKVYFWLNVYSDRLEKIRLQLGLNSTSELTRSPDGRHKFHITIGNVKC